MLQFLAIWSWPQCCSPAFGRNLFSTPLMDVRSSGQPGYRVSQSRPSVSLPLASASLMAVPFSMYSTSGLLRHKACLVRAYWGHSTVWTITHSTTHALWRADIPTHTITNAERFVRAHDRSTHRHTFRTHWLTAGTRTRVHHRIV